MSSSNVVTALAALLAVSQAPSSEAQPPKTSAQQPQPGGIFPMEVQPVSAAVGDALPQAPVLMITSIEIIRTAHAPVLDIIRVRGVTSTAGWEEGELMPLTRGLPDDGVLQLLFIARAPAEAAPASGFEPIEAVFPLESDHPFKGVTVYAATDSVSVSGIPGYAEGKSNVIDCGKCVGKLFVAKGASAPAAKSSELVREEQLGAQVRVIRPGDGISGSESNPNRLTLILNKDGRISTAVWE
jgi:hypothetical protein